MSQVFCAAKTIRYPSNLVGLSGGIGCGKSTALKILAELGCNVIESDRLVHELYEDLTVEGIEFRKQILEKWGNAILSEEKIDRRKIGQIVFNDESELEWLNSTVHPQVFSKADKLIKTYDKNSIVIFDIPLLFELGIEKEFEITIAIWTNKEQQFKRLRERTWTDSEIAERLQSQLSPDFKLEKASLGIINTGSLELLKEQCKQILFNIEKRIKSKGQ